QAAVGVLNDLWEYTPVPQITGQPFNPGQWTWVGGSSAVGQPGTYGTLGTAAAGNIPGARDGAVNWIDASGNFWLFGGNGCASSATTPCASKDSGNLNDLWEYSAGEWTWVSGSDVVNQSGTYGTLGTAGASNIPGARFDAVSWIDSSGNFWLFGGAGLDSADNSGRLNDLWKYGAGQWTWVGGSNVNGQLGTYGSVGMGGPSNIPGARTLGVSWTDASGNFWLFGGTGYDWLGSNGFLNDLWQFKP